MLGLAVLAVATFLLVFLVFQEHRTPPSQAASTPVVTPPTPPASASSASASPSTTPRGGLAGVADIINSPEGDMRQKLRGKWGEKNLQDWLDGQGITYRTENDLRGNYTKTPDALLDKPIVVNGWKINWIESKASFGDFVEVNKNTRKQLQPYVELFGQGLVVYWFGFVDEITMEDGIYITDSSLTRLNCRSVE